MTKKFNLDLPKHAADKVKRTLDDVLDLTDDPGEKLRIALMACSAPIGAAAGILSAMAGGGNDAASMKAATAQIMEILRLSSAEGPDAVMASLAAAN